LQGNIHRIDWARKMLSVDGGRFTRNHEITCDHLVLALGGITDLSRVPGMADHGRPLRTVSDALRLRATIINRLEEANLVEDETVRARLLTFVVVGGGYTGVETAGQLLDFVEGARKFYAHLRMAKMRVVLVHSQAGLLADIGPELGGYALKVLRRRGVEVRLETRVAEVTSAKAIFTDGEFVEAHTIVSTIGNAPHPLTLEVCRQIGLVPDRGRIPTETTLQVRGQTHLWAAGDGAAVLWNDRGTEKPSPPTAQFALRHGAQLGKNLMRALKGQAPQPFTYRYLGQMATIGNREAVAEVMGLHFSGFIAWWMWRTVYLGKLPGLRRKLRVMIGWSFELVFPRDLSLLLPPPEDILRSVHLEKNEALFKRGDACRAFFYLKRGQLVLTEPGQPMRVLGPRAVIDQAELDERGGWRTEAMAGESGADVVVIRGRALALLRTELQLRLQTDEDQGPQHNVTY
jgi:NADH:ubiquinone reductase (H+-translocating)